MHVVFYNNKYGFFLNIQVFEILDMILNGTDTE